MAAWIKGKFTTSRKTPSLKCSDLLHDVPLVRISRFFPISTQATRCWLPDRDGVNERNVCCDAHTRVAHAMQEALKNGLHIYSAFLDNIDASTTRIPLSKVLLAIHQLHHTVLADYTVDMLNCKPLCVPYRCHQHHLDDVDTIIILSILQTKSHLQHFSHRDPLPHASRSHQHLGPRSRHSGNTDTLTIPNSLQNGASHVTAVLQDLYWTNIDTSHEKILQTALLAPISLNTASWWWDAIQHENPKGTPSNFLPTASNLNWLRVHHSYDTDHDFINEFLFAPPTPSTFHQRSFPGDLVWLVSAPKKNYSLVFSASHMF